MDNFYITTPIYYVNDKPHIGHAYTTLACDVVARFKRQDGYNVKFLTGTDEHGLKVAQSAEKQSIDPKTFTDQVSQHFRELTRAMNFTEDDFIRTTEDRHIRAASSFWIALQKNGYIYKGKYAGFYSIRDEAYYNEEELIDGKAPTGAEVEWSEEETYFFKLSEFQDKLLDFYQANPDFIKPKSRYNEVVSFVRGGKDYKKGALRDLSISRTTFSWGVKVPGDEKHVMYVWLDALTNYLSALGFPETDNSEYQNFWPADIHVVGKDILRFHAVYWPAFLMAADLPLPKAIFAHGWWTNEGEKISKSIGNVIDPFQISNEFGLDQMRYFLLSHVIFGNDGDFCKEELIRKTNSDLSNNIGNLAQRILTMVAKNCNGLVPNNKNLNDEDQELINKGYDLINILRQHIQNMNFSAYLAEVIKFSNLANEYVDKNAPWQLRKTDIKRMELVLYTILEVIRIIAIYLLSFIPDSANKLLDLVAVTEGERELSRVNSKFALISGVRLPSPAPVFQRYSI
ncbi:MAG: methionine--tRNA ligase [Rickettsiales bacterium]|jgi:methionyl-tRNA synthetase|nr:methionine--tRNA ligase [Rickettsiales bacterium]